MVKALCTNPGPADDAYINNSSICVDICDVLALATEYNVILSAYMYSILCTFMYNRRTLSCGYEIVHVYRGMSQHKKL